MKNEFMTLKNQLGENFSIDITPLFPGVEAAYIEFDTNNFSVRHQHGSMENIIQINYCKAGQMEWKMSDDNHIYLNPGDFSVHTMNACTNSVITIPEGKYTGLSIQIDLSEADIPDFIERELILSLLDKLCKNNTVAFLSGNEETESIFSAFYNKPDKLRLPYQRLKVIELLVYLHKPELLDNNKLNGVQSDIVDIIHSIHDCLTSQINERPTIEALARQYHINPTTLKSAFKVVYGNSIAAHIKEHRMEKAARLLRETDMSIAQISAAVGYDSQSKFTSSFKAAYKVLPREYRKNHK